MTNTFTGDSVAELFIGAVMLAKVRPVLQLVQAAHRRA